MARMSRKLRVCKWVGTVGCALIALAFAWSWWWQLGFTWYSKRNCYDCTIGSGSIWFMRVPASLIPGNAGWDLRAAEGTPPGSGRPAIVPSVLAYEEADGYFVFVPLWMPFLILLVPTLGLRLGGRRSARRRRTIGWREREWLTKRQALILSGGVSLAVLAAVSGLLDACLPLIFRI